MSARIGIIGGSGIYDPKMFKVKENVTVSTPYGSPSGPIQLGTMSGKEVAFLPRHGIGHIFPPHKVNYRANIWALKDLGVERIISPCAVGSLQEDYKPGEIVIVDQFIDFTKSRQYTFYDGARTVHVSMADPFCPEVNGLFATAAKKKKIPFHDKGTYICVEGPRFSTRAESRMFRQFADIIGMTLAPECQLARELNMCYTSLAMITDYDVWSEEPVDTATVLRTMADNADKIRALLTEVIPRVPEKRTRKKCVCHCTLEDAGA